MTLYEFLNRIAKIVMPDRSSEFFDYLLHSCDNDGGFLRSRYCYSSNALPDSSCDYMVNTALITLEADYDFSQPFSFYSTNKHTNIKLQVHLGEYSDAETCYFEMLWASSVGYSYALVIDMITGTFLRSEFKYDKKRHYVIGQPKYSVGDRVRFRLDNAGSERRYLDGSIQDVEPFGNCNQQEEPSYNISVQGDLHLHIPESSIAFCHHVKTQKTTH